VDLPVPAIAELPDSDAPFGQFDDIELVTEFSYYLMLPSRRHRKIVEQFELTALVGAVFDDFLDECTLHAGGVERIIDVTRTKRDIGHSAQCVEPRARMARIEVPHHHEVRFPNSDPAALEPTIRRLGMKGRRRLDALGLIDLRVELAAHLSQLGGETQRRDTFIIQLLQPGSRHSVT